MTRGALTLLLLLVSWLSSLPELRAATAPAHAAVVAASEDEASAGDADYVAAQSATPEVPRAPLLARVPVAQVEGRPSRSSHHLASAVTAPDLRAALRRVQQRRRLPRLGGGEPPWS